jgi:uncharacterized SAM-binding protein YcdF (DUF218 family)
MSRWGHIGRRIVGATITLIILGWVAILLAVIAAGHRDEPRHADAIVVLGAAQYEGRPSPVLRARLDHAIELWRQALAPRVIVTGGTGVGDTTSEAAVSRKYLLQHGVPDSAIAMDTQGLTTSQSMMAVAELMRDAPHPTVLLVSDPFHMLRLSILARRLGMAPLISPTRTSPISASSGRRWKYDLAESVKVPFAFFMSVQE